METLFTELRQVFQDEYIHLGKLLKINRPKMSQKWPENGSSLPNERKYRPFWRLETQKWRISKEKITTVL